MGLVFFDNIIVSDEQENMAYGQLCKLSYWVQNEPVVTCIKIWQFVGWWYFCVLQIK